MSIVLLLIAGLIGYLCGAIPFGYIYVKLKTGEDIRNVGSGRTGGTNSLRAAGTAVGVLTGFSDVFKGALGVMLTRLFLGSSASAELMPWLVITSGVLSVIGHNWSVFMGWKGGAGTGPNVGWGTAVWWPMLPIGVLLMIVMLLTVGMASVASMSMALVIVVAFTILYALGIVPYDATFAYIIGGLISGLIVLWALRPNISRLMNGTERVVGPRARRMAKRQAAE
ncbi:MAG: glycerol-3-phosphate acyltransferase [Chloroflexota bacterium]